MFSKLFRAARLCAAAPNISKCSSKRTQVAFSRVITGGAESSQLLHWALRGGKTLSPPLHILNINPICTKWNCEEQQCQTQAFRVHESGLQQSWDWFLNHAINLPPPKWQHFCLSGFWKPKTSRFVLLVFCFFLDQTWKDHWGKKTNPLYSAAVTCTETFKLLLIFQELQWNCKELAKASSCHVDVSQVTDYIQLHHAHSEGELKGFCSPPYLWGQVHTLLQVQPPQQCLFL